MCYAFKYRVCMGILLLPYKYCNVDTESYWQHSCGKTPLQSCAWNRENTWVLTKRARKWETWLQKQVSAKVTHFDKCFWLFGDKVINPIPFTPQNFLPYRTKCLFFYVKRIFNWIMLYLLNSFDGLSLFYPKQPFLLISKWFWKLENAFFKHFCANFCTPK